MAKPKYRRLAIGERVLSTDEILWKGRFRSAEEFGQTIGKEVYEGMRAVRRLCDPVTDALLKAKAELDKEYYADGYKGEGI